MLVPIIVMTLPDDEENDQFMKSMFCLTVLGIGEIFGGFYIGYVIDHYGNKAASISNIITVLIQTIAVLAYIVIDEYSWLAFAMCFAWGFQDNCINTHCSELMGFEFDNSD